MTKCSRYNKAYITITHRLSSKIKYDVKKNIIKKKRKQLNFDKYKSRDKLLLNKRKEPSICYTGNYNCLFMYQML